MIGYLKSILGITHLEKSINAIHDRIDWSNQNNSHCSFSLEQRINHLEKKVKNMEKNQ